MSENEGMTIEEALKLAIDVLERKSDHLDDDYQEAADVLRQIGKPVERSEVVFVQCGNCGEMYTGYVHNCYNCYSCVSPVKMGSPKTKRWVETPVLKRVIEKSAPVYEPVGQTKGGRDE